MIKLPCIDLLHFDPVIRSYVITFIPKTKIEEKEVVSISFDSPEGIQIEDKLKTIAKLLGKNVITLIVHGGNNKFSFKFQDKEDLFDHTHTFTITSKNIFKELNSLGKIAEKSFLSKNEKKCQCELCKRHKRLKKIMAKLPEKEAEDLRDIIEGLECQEMDLDVWEAKANGSWPGWEKFGEMYKQFLKELNRVDEISKKDPVCQNCGTKENLIFASDPYQSEINDNNTEVWECESCRHESAMDI